VDGAAGAAAFPSASSHRRPVRGCPGADCRESSRLHPNARSEISYEISYQDKGSTKMYHAPKVLVPKDRKQDAQDNNYVQQRCSVPPFGSAVLSFDPDLVPLTIKRTPDKGNPSKTKLLVHIKKAV